jgi:hypothetical protein
MKIINSIPRYEAIVQLLKGHIERYGREISIGGIEVPAKLQSKLKKRSKGMRLQEAVDSKNLYLRGADMTQNGINWFGLVTDKFMPMPIADMAQAFYDLNKGSVIRYDTDRERYVISCGIGKFPETTHIFLDSGDFGTYGGNGDMSVRMGIALYNPGRCRVAVLEKDHIDRRFIHRWDHNNLDEVVEEIREFKYEANKRFCGNEYKKAVGCNDLVNYSQQLFLF